MEISRNPPPTRTQGPSDRALLVSSVVLSVPQALQATLQLVNAPTLAEGAKTLVAMPDLSRPFQLLLAIAVLLVATYGWRRKETGKKLLRAWQYLLIARRLRAAGPVDDAQRSRQRILLTMEIVVLEMPVKDFAERAHLTATEAEFVLDHPNFPLRPDVFRQIQVALMVPPDWPRQDLDDKLVYERLGWYFQIRAEGLTWDVLCSTDSQAQRDKLGSIQAEFRNKHFPGRTAE